MTDSIKNYDACDSFEAPDADNTPPTINCPPDITRTLQSGTFARVDWTDPPTATDDSGIVILTSRSRGPGFFEVNQPVQIMYTFSDPSGNEAVCSFTVTVIRKS